MYGPSPELVRWRQDRGDEILRLDYPLGASSTVVDAGGYRGQWASDIYARFGCTVHVFEPVSPFAQFLVWRFEHNPKVVIHDVGLAGEAGTATFGLAEESTSQYVGQGPAQATTTVRLVEASSFLRGLGLGQVDLMKINIEGGEYSLLEHLAETGYIRSITEIQVQFHDIFPDSADRLERARSLLSRTHSPRYQYDFVWESWYLAAQSPG